MPPLHGRIKPQKDSQVNFSKLTLGNVLQYPIRKKLAGSLSSRMDNGLEQEFLKAYETYADAMFRYCLVRIRNREEALDLSQEVFLKAWRYIAEGNEVKNMRAFLYEVARNLVINLSVKQKSVSLDDLMENGFEAVSRDDEKMETASLFHDALERMEELDEKYREPILMRYVDGLPVQEIAALLEENENTISVRIHRGIEQLRDLMNG